ncbi:hypothetical protein GYMLUDRAFT_67857 [Collybiopsis luxurians FD-317 M1]|nr:hypothetical protein GYMLUDRAFT_67857 [Collybiopsis luxurians FD-317 M1]
MYIKSSRSWTSQEKSQNLHSLHAYKQNIAYRVYLSSTSSNSVVIWKNDGDTVKSTEYVIPLSRNGHLPAQVVVGQKQKDGSRMALFSVLIQAFDPDPRVGVDIRNSIVSESQNELHLMHSATSHIQKVVKRYIVTVIARRQMSEESDFTAYYKVEIDVKPFSSSLKKQSLLSTYRL